MYIKLLFSHFYLYHVEDDLILMTSTQFHLNIFKCTCNFVYNFSSFFVHTVFTFPPSSTSFAAFSTMPFTEFFTRFIFLFLQIFHSFGSFSFIFGCFCCCVCWLFVSMFPPTCIIMDCIWMDGWMLDTTIH